VPEKKRLFNEKEEEKNNHKMHKAGLGCEKNSQKEENENKEGNQNGSFNFRV